MTASAESGPRRSRPSAAIVLGGVLLAGGALASYLVAASVAHRNSDKSRQTLALSSVEVGSTLRLALQREEELAVSATGFFLATPNATNAEFETWADTVQALPRYPELLGWGEVVVVPFDQLDEYIAQVEADPAAVVSADEPFEIIPPGDRPFYCFVRVGQNRFEGTGTLPGVDYCAGATGALAMAARDTGRSSYQAVDIGLGVRTLSVQVPFYRGGIPPDTVETRRQALAGWVGLAFDPGVLLTQALGNRPGTAVALRFHDATSNTDIEFARGTAPDGAGSAAVDLGNGWTAETSAAVAAGGVFDNGGAQWALLGGLATTVAVVALVVGLGTTRARALRLVAQRTQELRHQALHDTLTNLPNRALIMDRIEQLIVRNRRQGTVGAALYVDIDDFKNVNDTLGHEAGDHLLVAVAARLTSALRDADTIGRMSGDEFVVLIDGQTDRASPELVAERLLDVMREPFDLVENTPPLTVNASIGIAFGDRATGGDLLRDADVALYQAKASGKNRYETFQPQMQATISQRIELEFDLRSALDSEQFELVYQPIYNIDDLRLVGVEALLRWRHPRLGMMEPADFIPILEHTGLIHDVGVWVLGRACAQTAEWHAKGDTLDVSVNVSARQLDRDSFVEALHDVLTSTGLDPGSLILEVGEQTIMHDLAEVTLRLKAVKALGVRIAVDDVGSSYSPLSGMRQFPVDYLKIDRKLTHAISTSPVSKAMVTTLVTLGRDLGLRTLAKGVETAGEMAYLRKERVDEAQGFLLSGPLDAARLESEILAPRRH